MCLQYGNISDHVEALKNQAVGEPRVEREQDVWMLEERSGSSGCGARVCWRPGSTAIFDPGIT